MIKRYKLYPDAKPGPAGCPAIPLVGNMEDPDGDWVKWEDVEDIIEDSCWSFPPNYGTQIFAGVLARRRGVSTVLDFDRQELCFDDGNRRYRVMNTATGEVYDKELAEMIRNDGSGAEDD